MARESQGLQIALIIFVMLAIVLGVTTVIYHGRYVDALKAAKDNEEIARQERSKTANKEAECGELKRMIGMTEKSLADIKEQFDKDMKAYGVNFPEDARFYSPMINRLWEAVDDKSKDVKNLTVKLDDLDTRFKIRESGKDKQIKQFEDAVKTSGEDVSKLTKDYDEQRQQTLASQNELIAKLSQVRKQSVTQIERAGEEVKLARQQLQSVNKIVHDQAGIIDKVNRPTMEAPAGEIRWVNQRNSTVWINLGRADALERQTSFSVYSADSADLGKAAKKASIEVTKILGEHSAEARILDDKVADPIMPGDKIHTPLWTPGEQIHFALAGFMDIDGDGRNALGTVNSLITMNGGVVDCQIDEKGKRSGEMTAHTRFLVLGDEPSVKGQQEAIQAYSRMVSDAERLGVRKMTLTELKQKMGYKKQVTVERFGRDTSAPTGVKPPAGGKAGAKKARPKAEEPPEEK